jgi:CBS domain-containing protein
MIAKHLMDNQPPYLAPADSLERAETLFQDRSLSHLPVVQNRYLVGLLPAQALQYRGDELATVSDLRNDLLFHSVREDQHLIEVFETVSQHKITCVPVVTPQHAFSGVIETLELLNRLAQAFSFREPGSIILIDVGLRDYKLSEIASIVESENTKILSQYIDFNADHSRLYITLKLNVYEIHQVKSNLERFNYRVKVYAGIDEAEDELQDRYEMLMRYLDL